MDNMDAPSPFIWAPYDKHPSCGRKKMQELGITFGKEKMSATFDAERFLMAERY